MVALGVSVSFAVGSLPLISMMNVTKMRFLKQTNNQSCSRKKEHTTSKPVQKARPFPLIITARKLLSSRSLAAASATASNMARSQAFSLSGRLRLTRAIPSLSMVVSTLFLSAEILEVSEFVDKDRGAEDEKSETDGRILDDFAGTHLQEWRRVEEASMTFQSKDDENQVHNCLVW